MIHDMWGTDSWPSLDATPMPGDNGSYADYDRFLDAFFLLLVEDDIIENVWWDLWNEPDNGLWSDRGLDRYLEYWGHAHHKIVYADEFNSLAIPYSPSLAADKR